MLEVQTERVLVVPTELFHRLGHFQGFSHDIERYFADLFSPAATSFRPRSEVETDPSFKQLIPYVIFRYTDPAGRQHIFQYTRGKGQGEGRLHSKRSVGVGGHIAEEDVAAAGSSSLYQEGMRREITEEVLIETPYVEQCVGLINDDETEVGRVHLGVVHLCDAARPEVAPREPDIVDAGFRPIGEIMTDLSSFESWSQICLRALFGSNPP